MSTNSQVFFSDKFNCIMQEQFMRKGLKPVSYH